MLTDDIIRAMQNGAPVTCATCPRYHNGGGLCGMQTWGGPLLGRDFPDYNGLIPRERFVDRCLVCGSDKPRFGIIGLPTKFSLCAKHKKLFSESVPLSETDMILQSVTVIAYA